MGSEVDQFALVRHFDPLHRTPIGPGPAVDVNIEWWFEPGGKKNPWRTPVIVPGESHDFVPKAPDGKAAFHLDELTKHFSTMHLQGTCTDALGDHQVINVQADLREMWELIKTSEELAPTDHMRQIASELEKVRKEVEKIRTILGK